MLLRTAALLLLLAVSTTQAAPPEPPPRLDGLAPKNLVAWCIVPFDAKQRGPTERVAMLKRLGLRRVAYDWRAEHVRTFEAEIEAYKANGIEFFAFWDWHPSIEPLIRKHGIKPQIWKTCPSPPGDTHEARVEAAAKSLLPLVKKTRALGCRLGLYNHGGWGGKPANVLAVCDHLREHYTSGEYDAGHVGIVYNLHHGHDDIANFAESFSAMRSWLFCVNLNGMADAAEVRGGRNKILPIGQGQHEAALLRIMLQHGYEGPFGILDHRSDTDTEIALKANLDGLAKIVEDLRSSKSDDR